MSAVSPTPTAMTPTKTSTTAAARGRPCRASSATSGESTAATIAAVTTGATIAFVSVSRKATPAASTATPASSHDIIPRSRNHDGAAKTPLSSPGPSSTESPLCSAGGWWRLTRRMIVVSLSGRTGSRITWIGRSAPRRPPSSGGDRDGLRARLLHARPAAELQSEDREEQRREHRGADERGGRRRAHVPGLARDRRDREHERE